MSSVFISLMFQFIATTASSLVICQPSSELAELLRNFRFRKAKNIGVIIMKINALTLTVEEDETYEDITIEDIVGEVPDAEPRYLLISYVLNHDDGRVSYPQCFVFITGPITPQSSNPGLSLMYASSKLVVLRMINATKVFTINSSEELTVEWLEEKLSFFR